jgi:hypothetical protein
MCCERYNDREVIPLRDKAVPKQIVNKAGVAGDMILKLQAAYAWHSGFAAFFNACIVSD